MEPYYLLVRGEEREFRKPEELLMHYLLHPLHLFPGLFQIRQGSVLTLPLEFIVKYRASVSEQYHPRLDRVADAHPTFGAIWRELDERFPVSVNGETWEKRHILMRWDRGELPLSTTILVGTYAGKMSEVAAMHEPVKALPQFSPPSKRSSEETARTPTVGEALFSLPEVGNTFYPASRLLISIFYSVNILVLIATSVLLLVALGSEKHIMGCVVTVAIAVGSFFCLRVAVDCLAVLFDIADGIRELKDRE